MIRLLVTGGRNFDDAVLVFRTLDGIHSEKGIALLIHGGANGADHLAQCWCDDNGCWSEVYAIPTEEWTRVGKKAGPLRNGRMIREGRPDLVVAFPGGPGTADCCRQAKAAGVEVRHAK
jgi:hypothetical protein